MPENSLQHLSAYKHHKPYGFSDQAIMASRRRKHEFEEESGSGYTFSVAQPPPTYNVNSTQGNTAGTGPSIEVNHKSKSIMTSHREYDNIPHTPAPRRRGPKHPNRPWIPDNMTGDSGIGFDDMPVHGSYPYSHEEDSLRVFC